MVEIIKRQIEVISQKITELLKIPFKNAPYKKEHTELHRMEVEAISMTFNCVKTLAERVMALEAKQQMRDNSEKLSKLLSKTELELLKGGKDEIKSE
jgi:hypothetical protein